MGKTDRVYTIEMLIHNRGCVSFQTLRDELEVSDATLKRDLEFLRDRLNAPIEYDRTANGYRFAAGYAGPKHELPGLWFDERELYALLMASQLLSEIDSNQTISRHLQPLLARIHTMLGTTEPEAAALLKRIKIISPTKRPVAVKFFEGVGEALVKRRRLHMRYFTRGRRTASERDVSPQRLVHYRSTWYLDAWCHTRDGLLRFALDAIEDAQVLDEKAKDVSLARVEAEMDGGYGIYAGGKPHWAKLLVQPQAAQWISREQWHPQQRGRWLDDGCYELEVPFIEQTEIVMDILRQGDQVRVVAPSSLATAVAAKLEGAAQQYR